MTEGSVRERGRECGPCPAAVYCRRNVDRSRS
jgi:hypothetical protein